MSWTIRLQGARGNPLSPKDALIEFHTIPRTGDFRLLKYVDDYGDTVFNGIQMDDFLSDWDSLTPDASQLDQWKMVREMAVKCKEEPHHYLRFVGD